MKRRAHLFRDEEARAVEALISGRVFILRLDVLFYWIWFKCNPANDNYGGPHVDREE